MKKISSKQLSEIEFRFKRVGYFGILWLFLIALLIGFVCYVEISLKANGTIGLNPEMETILPIFYGIISLFLAACWTFCICVAILIIIQHREQVHTIPGLYACAIAACFVPIIFGFVGYAKVAHQHRGPKKADRKPFEPYEFKGNHYYFDDQGNYFIAVNDEWVKTNNPHKKR